MHKQWLTVCMLFYPVLRTLQAVRFSQMLKLTLTALLTDRTMSLNNYEPLCNPPQTGQLLGTCPHRVLASWTSLAVLSGVC